VVQNILENFLAEGDELEIGEAGETKRRETVLNSGKLNIRRMVIRNRSMIISKQI